MQIKSQLNNLRMAPRKVRLVVNLIKGLPVVQAKAQLQFFQKRASRPLLKLLESSQANAAYNFGLDKDNLFIKEMMVNEGRPYKRWMSRAFGRVSPVWKRTSHINLILEEIESGKGRQIKKAKPKETPIAKIQKRSSDESSGVAGQEIKPKLPLVRRPFAQSSVSKKRFFSRQTLKNASKIFRRKAV